MKNILLKLALLGISIVISTTLIAQNNCLEFDGTNDYVATTYTSSIQTVEFWFKTNDLNKEHGLCSQRVETSTTSEKPGEWNLHWGWYASDEGKLRIYAYKENGSGHEMLTNTVFQTGQWYHFAFTSNGSNVVFYVNGVYDSEHAHDVVLGGSENISPFRFGGYYTNGNLWPFNGTMDEVRLWNDVRTEDEIRQNMYRELPDPSGEGNLIAYYKLNETSGTTADDSKGSYDGTLTNMTGSEWQTSPAMFGPKNCLEFSGDTEHVKVATLSPSFTQGTISFWIKPKATPVNHARVLSDHWDDDEIYLSSGAGNIATWHMIDGDELISSNPLPNNQWTHVAITMDNISSKLYINGILDDEKGPSDTDISTDFEIGGYSTSGNHEVVNGYLDEFCFWSDVRTASEIRENMYKTLTGNEENLIAYYNFDNSSGTALQDFSGNENDGILTNMNNSDWVTSSAFNTWLNTSSTTWAMTSNWSDGAIPTSSDNVGIYDWGNSSPEIISSQTVNNLNVGTGVSVQVKTGGDLTVNDNLFVSGTFSLESTNSGTGSLITNGTITNNGTIDVEREISDDKWHLISSPNSVTTANTFAGDYLQTWNEPTASWSDITEITTALNPLQGYSLWGVAKATTHTFSGTPNTGNQSIALSYTAVAGEGNDGANLLGNPYPSSIDWADLDDTWGAVYYWNGTQYATWNDGSATNGGVQYIPPMQGFFIVVGSSGTFELTNDNRTHEGASAYFKSSENIVSNSLLLEASSEDKSDELFIRINPNSSENFELKEDAYKMLSSTVGLPQLYSFSDDNILSIDVRPETDIIQLGFQNDKAGDYSIGIKDMSDVTQAILEDTKTGVMHNLQNDSYNFLWELSDDEKRFKLHLETNEIENVSEDFFSLYANNNMLYVKTDKTINNGSIKVIDLLGRVMIEQEIKSSNNLQLATNLDTGIYIVVVEDGEKIGSEKVLIK